MEQTLDTRPDVTVEPGPYGIASGTQIDGKRVGDWQPPELETDKAQVVTVDERDIYCLMRNANHLAMYATEMVDRTDALVNAGVVHMTADDTRSCCERIQRQIGATR